MRLARRRLAENAAIGNLAVTVNMPPRRATRIAGPHRHPIGREIGQARAEARIDLLVENFGGRLDMRIGIENAQPVFHAALPT